MPKGRLVFTLYAGLEHHSFRDEAQRLILDLRNKTLLQAQPGGKRCRPQKHLPRSWLERDPQFIGRGWEGWPKAMRENNEQPWERGVKMYNELKAKVEKAGGNAGGLG